MNIYQDTVIRLDALGVVILNDNDPGVLFAIQQAEVAILTNINALEVPDELKTVFIDMACGYYLQGMKAFGRLNVDSLNLDAPAKSIKEGDVQITFASAADGSLTPEARVDSFIDSLLHPSPDVFTHFRRLTW